MRELLAAVMEEFRLMGSVHFRGALMMAAVPLLYTLLFGALFYENTLTALPVAVVDTDGGAAARGLVKGIADAPELSLRAVLSDAEEAEAMLLRQEIVGAAVIPPDFSESLASGRAANVEVILSLANTVSGGTAGNAMQSVIGSYGAEVIASQKLAAGWDMRRAREAAGGVALTQRSLYNQTGGYEDFFLAVLAIHAMQIGIVFTAAPMLSVEKFRRRAELSAHPAQAVLSKLAAYSLTTGLVFLISLALAAAAFGLAWRGSLFETAALVFSFSLAMHAFALAVGAWVRRPTMTITYTLFYIMPSVLFTGAIWPRWSMDAGSLALSYTMPIGYAAESLRDLLIRGYAPDLAGDILVLLAFAAVFAAAARAGLARLGKEGA